ncbi:MAG: thiopeptide-type bacteriocin biosynthesis protein [Pseudonocardiaceae bacterium]
MRVRFRGDPATLGSRVLPALSAWCQEMIRQRLSGGFTVEPYDQELERYGGPAAIGAAEHVFAADSSLALAILASVSRPSRNPIMTSVSRQQALATAERLLNTEDILAAVPAGGFLNGLAGTALLHARLAAVDPVFAQAAVRHWAAASQNSGPHRGAAGIFSNPGGLAASLIIGSAYLPDPDSQRAVTTRAVRWLAARAVDLAYDRTEHLRAGGVGTPWAMYDAINGPAGGYPPVSISPSTHLGRQPQEWHMASPVPFPCSRQHTWPDGPSLGSAQQSRARHTGCCAGARTPRTAGRPMSRVMNWTAAPHSRSPDDVTPGATAPRNRPRPHTRWQRARRCQADHGR